MNIWLTLDVSEACDPRSSRLRPLAAALGPRSLSSSLRRRLRWHPSHLKAAFQGEIFSKAAVHDVLSKVGDFKSASLLSLKRCKR